MNVMQSQLKRINALLNWKLVLLNRSVGKMYIIVSCKYGLLFLTNLPLHKVLAVVNFTTEEKFNFELVSASDIFCYQDSCFGEREGDLLYFDGDHPSILALQKIVE